MTIYGVNMTVYGVFMMRCGVDMSLYLLTTNYLTTNKSLKKNTL